MKTKQEFVAEYVDKLAGIMLTGFAQESQGTHDGKSKWIQMRLNDVRPMLEQMYGFITEEVADTGGIDDQVEYLIRQYELVGSDTQEKVLRRLRQAFKPKGDNNGKVEANGHSGKQAQNT